MFLKSIREISMKVWLVVVAHGVTDLSQGGLLVALPFLKAKFGLSYAEVSAIALLQHITSSVSQPIFGYLSDRSPRPWLVPLGCLLSGIGMLSSLWASNYYLVLCFTAITGLGIAAFHPEAAKMVNKLSGTSKGKAVSIFVVGGNAGFALGSVLMAIILSTGLNHFSFLYLIPFLITALLLRKLTRNNPFKLVNKKVESLNFKKFLNVALVALLGVIMIRATVQTSLSTFLPLYYISYLGGNELYASSILSIFLASGAIGTLFGGMLSDKYGSKNVMIYTILPVALMIYLFKGAEGVMVFPLLIIASALLSCAFSSSLVLAQQMMPNNIGMASGIILGLSVGMGAFGMQAMGKAADIWGLPVVFDILVILPIIGFICAFFIKDALEDNKINLKAIE